MPLGEPIEVPGQPAQLVFGFIFPCCDRKLNQEFYARDIRLLRHIAPQSNGQASSDRFNYAFESAGANFPFMSAHALEVFVQNAKNVGAVISIPEVYFFTHTECAGERAHMAMSPEDGARWFVRIYKQKQSKYPDVLITRPELFKIHVDTVHSSITGRDLEQLPADLWNEQPLELNDQTKSEILDLLRLA